MTARIVAAALAAACTFPVAALARPWSPADVSAAGGVISAEASSRGDVLFGNAAENAAKNEFDTTYYVRTAAGVVHRLAPQIPVVAAHWTPDGRLLAIVTPAAHGTTSLVLVDPLRDKPLRTIFTGNVIHRFAFSPSGAYVAVVATQPPNEQRSESVWLAPEGDALGTPPERRFLSIVDVRSGAARRVGDAVSSYGGPVTDRDPSWSPDGRNLLAVRQPSGAYGDFEHAENVEIDVASGAVSRVGGPVAMLPDTIAPQFAGDGRMLTVHTWDGTFTAREDLFVDGRDVSAAFDHDFWSCGNSLAQWDGRDLLATTRDGVDQRLYRFTAAGEPVALTPPGGSVLAFSAWKRGIFVAYSTPVQPPELFALSERGELHRLTNLNALPAGLAVVPTRLVHWESKNGHTLVGQLTAARDGSALLTEPHGGPQCADDSSFSPFVQYYAANGFAYFRPSVTGSDGYGDWSYKAIQGDFGPGPLDDLLRGVDVAGASSNAAPGAFLYGASYGGYLTAYAVTHSDRFKAAVAAIPVTDIALDYELSESPNITRRFFGRTPLIDAAAQMDAQSPASAAQALRTPLLLMIGLRDTRAPFAQTLAFYRKLVELGKPVRLLAYPEEGHGPSTPRAVADWVGHVAGWFAAHGGPHADGALLPPGR